MFGLDNLETLFVITAFLFQIVLIGHFALRSFQFALALQYGPIVYALSVPAMVVSVALMMGSKTWVLWVGGFIYLLWAAFGYTVEYLRKIDWRDSIGSPIFVIYLCLYLATVMFYWWPLALLFKPLWYGYALLFTFSTILNLKSHKRKSTAPEPVRRGERGQE